MPRYEVILNKEKREASIRMYGVIGSDIDGNAMAHELSAMDTEVDTVNLLINSNGGDVSQGLSIISAILSAKAYIHAYVNGIAASMAAVIAVSADKVTMQDYAKMMIHDPYFSGIGKNKLSDRDRKALDSITDTLRTILSRRGCRKDTIAQLMNEETWFSAEEAKTAGLADEVVSTPRKEELCSLSATELLSRVMNDYKPFKNKTSMKEIAKEFGLTESATEQEIVQEIRKRVTDSATRENSIVERLIAIGEAHGTVTEKNKERMKRLALADFELFAETVTDFGPESGKQEEPLTGNDPHANRLSGMINRKSAGSYTKQAPSANGHNWEWYQKNNPQALMTMERENPDLFKKLLDEYEQSI